MNEEECLSSVRQLPSRIPSNRNKSTAISKPSTSNSDRNNNDNDKEIKSFDQFNIHPTLIHSLRLLNIHKPTSVQSHCLGPIMSGRDCIGTARTGSGKTIAFALPILQTLTLDPFGICALVLTPTRELAFQIADQFHALGSHFNLQCPVIVGGLDMMNQTIQLQNRPHVIIATPGRFADILNGKGNEWNLNKLKYLVLDEADRLLTETFSNDLNDIMKHLPKSKQTLLFTATATDSILALKDKEPQPGKQKPYVHLLEESDVKTPKSLKQYYVHVPSHIRDPYLHYLLINPPEIISHLRHQIPDLSKSVPVNAFDDVDSKKRKRKDKVKSEEELQLEKMQPVPTIVFTSRCQTAAQLTLELQNLKVRCTPLHSYLSQNERLNSLNLFRAGIIPVLIATDVGSRGLDIPEVTQVVNYDLPRNPDDYVHRVGRTARAGRLGLSISFVGERDIELLQSIESKVNCQMAEHPLPENKVMENLNKVFTARRVASMTLHDNKFGEKQKINKSKNKKRMKLSKSD